MFQPKKTQTVAPRVTPVVTPPAPRALVARSLQALAANVPGVEVVFGGFGEVRSLMTTDPKGLLPRRRSGRARTIARALLEQKTVSQALELQNARLENGATEEFPTFTRVEFKQCAFVGGCKFTVRGGYIHAFVNTDGTIFAVNSTVRQGTKPKKTSNIVSEERATELAKAQFGEDGATVCSTELVLSSHEDRMDLVYEIVLASEKPRRVDLFLVKAATSEVVHQSEILLHKSVEGSAIIGEPTLDTPINDQFHDIVLDDLTVPTELVNHRFRMEMRDESGEWVPIKAKADGTYKFDPNNPEEQTQAHGVTAFFALNEQQKLLESLGSAKQTRVLPVRVDNSDVEDNADFDPWNYWIDLGEGTTRLAHFLSLASMVEWHENGHHSVYLNTPAHDLPGSQGRADNEGFGGDFQALLMYFYFKAKYGKQLGINLTKADILADPLEISPFTMPRHGIRSEKGDAQATDLTGEEHHDGLVPGQAAANVLVHFATADGVEMIDGLTDAAKLYLVTLQLVPGHNVLFTDILRAMLTADQHLFAGAHKDLITQSFADHGVKLASHAELLKA